MYRLSLLLLVLLLAVSCAEVKTYEPKPIGISAFSTPSTKGYVDGELLTDTQSRYLHGGGTPSPRKIVLTTWHYESAGGESEYFRDRSFEYEEDPGGGFWHGTPATYWPMGGRLDFTGYSVSIPFADSQVSWGRGRSTDELIIDVTRPYTQDDILFSSRLSLRGVDDDGKVAMQFQHAQAWIEVVVQSAPESENVITLDRVEFKDIYTEGRLTITHPFGFAEGDWSFDQPGVTRKDTDMDDVNHVFGTKMTAQPQYLDWLIPGQRMKSMVLHYSMEGSDMHLEHEYTMPVTEWLGGKKYIYNVTFAPRGIELLPVITDWDGVTPVNQPQI